MILTTRRLFTAILFVALFIMATREIADPDFWWHLRTGQFIVQTGSIPHADIFSYTNSGKPWVTHEWLSEVLIYTVYRAGSFPALVLAFAAIIVVAFALVFSRSGGRPYVAAFALLLAAFATAPTWGVRPQIISLLMTSVFLWVLEKNRTEIAAGRNYHPSLWLLVPLTILWVNLHSGFALGVALIAVYLFGQAVERSAQHARFILSSPLVKLGIVFVCCLVVIPLNPNGATMYLYPFETLTSHAMQTYIQEWFSPDFHLAEWQPFAWLLLGTMAAVGLSGKRPPLTHVLLFVILGYASLRSVRMIPTFALVAAPLLADQLWTILEMRGWTDWYRSPARTTRAGSVLNWLVLALILVAAVLRAGIVIGNQSATERAQFPAAAVDFLQTQPAQGPIYNAYGWGGYLIWRSFPAQMVFIDGRADVYGDAFIEEFLTTWRAGPDWRARLDRFRVQVVLIERQAPLAAALAQEPGWKQVYADQQAVIFSRGP